MSKKDSVTEKEINKTNPLENTAKIDNPLNSNQEKPMMTLEDEIIERIKQHQLPHYLLDVYEWAYINPRNIKLLDNSFIYHAILFGQGWKLMNSYLSEIKESDRALQVAHVYGNLIKKMAQKVGAKGSLDLIDVVPYQLERAQKKLKEFKNVDMWLQDAANPYHREYDFVGVYFLLHEVPDNIKRQIIDNTLKHIDESNAKVVFIDYHYPSPYQPVRGILSLVNTFLEPYANSMWEKEIPEFTNKAHKYNWEKTTFFGGVYQKMVVTKKVDNKTEIKSDN